MGGRAGEKDKNRSGALTQTNNLTDLYNKNKY